MNKKSYLDKIGTKDALLVKVNAARNDKKKIVFTNGCFDLIHAGHIRYLAEAKALGDMLIVAINSDSSVRKLKGLSRPIVEERDRAEVIAALEMVDQVTIFDDDTPVQLIANIKPDIHVKGGDYKAGDLPESGLVKENGGTVVILPFWKGRSTTDIIAKIMKSKDIQ
ncbi:MAG: D-glycero-beta-D-manno-heptose 1-phosphate adenylyltransferase [Candidatus Margulisiibacteriota bacterium]|jgi:glycerol-3-phosphate cytidylyltransferase